MMVARFKRGAHTRLSTSIIGAALLSALFTTTHASALELNVANQAQLESLKGIGVEASDRILEERAKGDFKDWPDFMKRVKGVK
ncbi:hypothetical protein BH09PSE5_BH09PSE5_15430 [soil metagenome]